MEEADLGSKSIPRNPLLFNMLYRMEAVEHIGSGIRRIRDLCEEYGIEEPLIEISPHWFSTVFKRPMVNAGADQEETTPHVTKLITTLKGAMSREELMSLFSLKDRKYFMTMYIKPALNAGYIEMTVPEKPRSSKQKYMITKKGKELLYFLNDGKK